MPVAIQSRGELLLRLLPASFVRWLGRLEPSAETAGTDQLFVAIGRGEINASLALAFPSLWHGAESGVVEGVQTRPDTGVENANNDIVALPRSEGEGGRENVGEVEEMRGASGMKRVESVRENGENGRGGLEDRNVVRLEEGGVTVEGGGVGVKEVGGGVDGKERLEVGGVEFEEGRVNGGILEGWTKEDDVVLVSGGQG